MKTENRIVMTLDAGGTNLVFSAIRNNEEIVTPVHLRSEVNDLDACLRVLLQGFSQVKEALTEEPVAISFAFPDRRIMKPGLLEIYPISLLSGVV